jgi:hypothetical protein
MSCLCQFSARHAAKDYDRIVLKKKQRKMVKNADNDIDQIGPRSLNRNVEYKKQSKLAG